MAILSLVLHAAGSIFPLVILSLTVLEISISVAPTMILSLMGFTMDAFLPMAAPLADAARLGQRLANGVL